MQVNAAIAALLLQSIAAPCLARSTQRSTPLTALDLPPLLNITTLNDPALPIATLPYDVPLSDLSTIKLRIITYTPPHVPSFTLLPCLVDMMSTAFTNALDQDDTHARLANNEYSCSKDSFGIEISGSQITAPLEYSDLISLAQMLVTFQQEYTMPGLGFEYWDKGQMIGQGHAWMQFARSAAGNETVGVSQS